MELENVSAVGIMCEKLEALLAEINDVIKGEAEAYNDLPEDEQLGLCGQNKDNAIDALYEAAVALEQGLAFLEQAYAI